MENSPLNKAHQLDRHAEALLKQSKFDECSECYKTAIKYLHDSLNLTENPYSKESILLQIENHQKQIESIKVKKAQYEYYRRHKESIKHRIMNFDSICEDSDTVQSEIFRTMEMHDSLMEVLFKRQDDESLRSYSTSDTDERGSDKCDGIKVTGNKRQVDDSTLLEEFKGLSEKLRELVLLLVYQLEEKDSEISRLKAEVAKLKSEQNNKEQDKGENTLKVITDSSGGTSPYVYSPCSELSPEVHDSNDLPALTPLEMPSFDYGNLVQNANNLNLNGPN